MILQVVVITSLLFLSTNSLAIAMPLSSASHSSSLRRTFRYRGLKQQTPPTSDSAPPVSPQVIETAVQVGQESAIDAKPQGTNDKNDEDDGKEKDEIETQKAEGDEDGIDETNEDKEDGTDENEIEQAEQDEDEEAEIVDAEVVEAEIVEAETVEAETVEAETVEVGIAEAETLELDEEKEQVDKEEEDKGQVDNEDVNEGELPVITFVALPETVLQLGVNVNAADGDRAFSLPSDYTAMEALIKEYMEGLWPNDVMGSNYVSSDLKATMSKGTALGESGGVILDFTIQGLAEYHGDPVPQTKELKDRLTWFFSRWQGQELFQAFLEENGIYGTQLTNVYVDSENVPISANADSINGATSDAGSDTEGSSEGSSDGGGSKAGLVVGLLVVVMCMLVAALVLYHNRQLIAKECKIWRKGCKLCGKSRRDKMQEKKLGRLGWTNNFDEEGSATVPPNEDRSQRVAPTFKLPKWLARPHRDEADEEGSATVPPKEDRSQRVAPTFKLPKWLSRPHRDKAAGAEGLGMVQPEEDISRRVAATFSKQPPKLPKCLAWLQRDYATTKEEDPSQVLPNVQVVVDTDHVSRQPVGSTSHRISYWDMSKLHSEVTAPRGNHKVPHYEEVSPQKTSTSNLSDDDDKSLGDPIVRYAPPTRSQGRMCKSKNQHPSSPSTVASTPSPRQSRSSAPPVLQDQEKDSNENSFADWADFLNPCLPNVSLFRTQSGNLNGTVANVSDMCARSDYDEASAKTSRRKI
jgi:hypothetical protein